MTKKNRELTVDKTGTMTVLYRKNDLQACPRPAVGLNVCLLHARNKSLAKLRRDFVSSWSFKQKRRSTRVSLRARKVLSRKLEAVS